MTDSYAKIVNGIVENIIVADKNFIEEFCNDDVYILCTDNDNAQIGGEYTKKNGFFPPKPYHSWIKKENTWVAPKEIPSSPGDWRWNEDAQEWVDVSSL